MPLLQACLNGPATSGVPLTPEEIAAAAVGAVTAGAGDLHVHAKDGSGRDSVAPEHVGAVVSVVRSALTEAGLPVVPVGVTTAAWAVSSPQDRLTLVSAWAVLPEKPDSASVNWHEPGAEELAGALLALGVAVEAGVWTVSAAAAYAVSPLAGRCLRVLAEVQARDPQQAVAEAEELLAALEGVQVPVLLHGEGPPVWEVLDAAVSRGLATRIGLEDVGAHPGVDNAGLVREALARGAGE